MTIEDPAELQLPQENWVSLETRPDNVEGKGLVSQRDLVKNSLRMRPDRIIIGECRGSEAFDMLQAMNTGHDGSLTTIHANTPRDAISRVENMVLMANLDLPAKAIREQIASAINLVIQLARMSDGSRRVTHVTELVGMEQEIISMQEIFVFRRYGIDENDRVLGALEATGILPNSARKLELFGYPLTPTLFAAPEIPRRKRAESVPTPRKCATWSGNRCPPSNSPHRIVSDAPAALPDHAMSQDLAFAIAVFFAVLGGAIVIDQPWLPQIHPSPVATLKYFLRVGFRRPRARRPGRSASQPVPHDVILPGQNVGPAAVRAADSRGSRPRERSLWCASLPAHPAGDRL